MVTRYVEDTAVKNAVAPTAVTPIASKTSTGDGWDSGTGAEIAITAGAEFLHVHVNQNAYLVPSTSTDDPAQNGAIYVTSQTHVIPCKGLTLLHYKNASAGVNVTVSATAFGN